MTTTNVIASPLEWRQSRPLQFIEWASRGPCCINSNVIDLVAGSNLGLDPTGISSKSDFPLFSCNKSALGEVLAPSLIPLCSNPFSAQCQRCSLDSFHSLADDYGAARCGNTPYPKTDRRSACGSSHAAGRSINMSQKLSRWRIRRIIATWPRAAHPCMRALIKEIIKRRHHRPIARPSSGKL